MLSPYEYLTLKIDATTFSETSISAYKTAQCHMLPASIILKVEAAFFSEISIRLQEHTMPQPRTPQSEI
jgi:hypothetical protein